MQEVWRPVIGYEDAYEVSDLGNVASLTRIVPHGWSQWQVVPCTKLKPFVNRGYYKVNLYNLEGKAKPWPVHRLVAFAHLGPCPDGLIVLHGPKGPLCNEVSNLSYGTYKQNMRDKLRDGTACLGVQNPCSKLTEAQVIDIYTANLGPHMRRAELAIKHNVTEATVKAIRTGRNWQHLTNTHENGSRL